MTTPDIEPILDRWLGEGTDVLPDRSVGAGLRTIEHTSQRRAFGARWRFPTMNGNSRLALLAARRSSRCSSCRTSLSAPVPHRAASGSRTTSTIQVGPGAAMSGWSGPMAAMPTRSRPRTVRAAPRGHRICRCCSSRAATRMGRDCSSPTRMVPAIADCSPWMASTTSAGIAGGPSQGSVRERLLPSLGQLLSLAVGVGFAMKNEPPEVALRRRV